MHLAWNFLIPVPDWIKIMAFVVVFLSPIFDLVARKLTFAQHTLPWKTCVRSRNLRILTRKHKLAEVCAAKNASFNIFVVVMPKEGLVHPRLQILLLVWQQQVGWLKISGLVLQIKDLEPFLKATVPHHLCPKSNTNPHGEANFLKKCY